MSEENEPETKRVFAVIDPERLVQPALDRGSSIAAHHGAVLHVYCCLGQQGVDASDRRAVYAVERTMSYLNRLAVQTLEHDINTEIEVEWDANWRQRLVEAARTREADLVIKTVSRHVGLHRRLRETADWTLLENTHCPVLLVDPIQPRPPRTVLAAVKLDADREQPSILNEKVVSTAHRLNQELQGELHAVTVYKGDKMYFDRQRLADSCRLPRKQVHSAEGSPHKGIAQVVAEEKVDLLVIGCAQSSGGMLRFGDTARRVIDEVDSDIYVVPGA